jgi:RNA polymerase-interacting CarD/CdnL/TRCF family regulator
MRFQVGDKVFHPISGVGHIETIEKKIFLGTESRLYYQVATDKSTVWVPVDAQAVIGLRPLTTKRDLARFRSVLKSRPASLTNNHGKRHLEISNRLKGGSLEVMCEAVRDLAGRGWHKPLSNADASSLRKAREALCQEWAAADGVSIAEASQEVESLLTDGRKAHKG